MRSSLLVTVFIVLAGCEQQAPAVLGSAPSPSNDAGPTVPPKTPDAAVDAATTPDASTPAPGDALATAEHRPGNLRANTTRLVWLRDDVLDGAVVTLPLGGGTATALANALVQPDALHVDESAAYFLTAGSQSGIRKVALGGGPVETLVASASPSPLRDLALDATFVYFTDAPAGKLRRVPKAGGAASVVASGLAAPTSLAIDGATAWVTESGDDGAIVEVALGDGAKVTVASGQSNPHDVVATVDAIYWIDDGTFDPQTQSVVGAALMKVARSGGPPTLVAATSGLNHLFVDGGFVYAAADSAIVRAPTSGGALAPFAAAQAQPSAITAAGTFVFWTNLGTANKGWADGSLQRLGK